MQFYFINTLISSFLFSLILPVTKVSLPHVLILWLRLYQLVLPVGGARSWLQDEERSVSCWLPILGNITQQHFFTRVATVLSHGSSWIHFATALAEQASPLTLRDTSTNFLGPRPMNPLLWAQGNKPRMSSTPPRPSMVKRELHLPLLETYKFSYFNLLPLFPSFRRICTCYLSDSWESFYMLVFRNLFNKCIPS